MSRYRRAQIPGGTFFFTLVTYRRFPLLASDHAVSLLRTCLDEVIATHPFTVDALVILPDHVHSIWTMPEGDSDFSLRWRLVKTRFSRRFEDDPVPTCSPPVLRKNERGIWQRRFWEHCIRDQRDFEAHCDYIHYNPVKHGLAAAPHDWKHSTFHEFVAGSVYPPDWAEDVVPKGRAITME